MKISVVIPVHNEGPDLETTVAMVASAEPRPWEIIVVDDASSPGFTVADRVRAFDVPVRTIRLSQQHGPTRARSVGVAASEGDAVVLMDSHMRVPQNWTALVERALTAHPKALVCPSMMAFAERSPWGCGADLGTEFGVEPKWRTDVQLGRGIVDGCPAIIGALYGMTRESWEILGGYNPLLWGWGSEETDLSLRAWLFGLEVRRIHDLVVEHNFRRRQVGYFSNSWEASFCLHVVAATVFEDGVYERLFEWAIQERFPLPQVADRLDARRDLLMSYRERVQAKRRLSDRALAGRGRRGFPIYRLPTVQEQRDTIERFMVTDRNKRAAQAAGNLGDALNDVDADERAKIIADLGRPSPRESVATDKG